MEIIMSTPQFTYKDLTRTANRKEMLEENVSSLGTQAGHFGAFKEQARVVTLSGSKKIQEELSWSLGGDVAKLLDECPTLKALIQ